MAVLRLQSARLGLATLCAVVGGLWLVAIPAGAVALPDGRVFETVSPINTGQDANVFVPLPSASALGGFHGIESQRPFEVAPDGETVAYSGEPPPTGGDGGYGFGEGNEFLAKRLPGGGWTATDIQLPGKIIKYQAFSSDLSIGVFNSEEQLSTDSAPFDYFSRATAGGGGKIHPFVAREPGSEALRHASFGGSSGGPLYAGGNSGTALVPGFSHLLLEAEYALTPESVEGGSGADNLYDSVGGRLYPVNVLPDGQAQPDAAFGSFPTYQDNAASPPGLSHEISADGSRIVWTALELVEIKERLEHLPKAIYVRENDTSPDATTVQVDAAVGGGGFFRTASTDGSKVFFTKGDLYRYDVNSGQTLDLTPGVTVKGVMGTSDDGEYVYYVDSNYKLHLWREGTDTVIATLSLNDGGETFERFEGGVLVEATALEVSPFGNGGGNGTAGDWRPEIGYKTSEVTPDGHDLVFMSNQSLTGYDNNDEGTPLFEVFLYEADSGKLTCVSCEPKGTPPVPTNVSSKLGIGGFLPISKNTTYQPQIVSPDGSRVFFDSAQPLVAQDINGWYDVYEWERNGTGSCRESQGCVYLLSGGVGPENSYLIGPSESGHDVFFVTRAQLAAADRNDNDDVYDARVDGLQPPALPSCEGSGCQGVPPAPPIFATPASVTFNGVGNFPPPSSAGAKPKAKSLTKAQKLARALKACRVKRNAHRRGVCEARAKKSYGSKSNAARSNAKSNGRSK